MNIKADDKKKILFILLAGILIRVLYVIFMPVVNFAQYDIGTVDPGNGVLTGHLGYIFYLVVNRQIPQFDPTTVYQFNHPPVHYIISALWVSFIKLFTNDTRLLIESVQFVTLVYSVVTLYAFERVLDELKVSFNGKALALTIFALQPTIVMTAGSVNNDGIGLMFQMLATWAVLRWYRTRSYKDIVFLAFSISIGMLSKLSAGLIAFPVAVLFLYVFIKEWREKGKFPLSRFIQYAVFGAICVPIGLFWVLRCYIRFGMSFTYIAFLPDTSWQYVGMYSEFERLFFPNVVELIKNLSHGSIGMGWNIWIQMFRTSALGECDLALFPMAVKLICLLTVMLNFIVAVWAFVCFVRYLAARIKSDKDDGGVYGADAGYKLFWFIAWFIMMYSYFSFANKYPHECSMNFRYVQYAIVPPLVALGTVIGKNGKGKVLLRAVTALYGVFSIFVLACWVIFA